MSRSRDASETRRPKKTVGFCTPAVSTPSLINQLSRIDVPFDELCESQEVGPTQVPQDSIEPQSSRSPSQHPHQHQEVVDTCRGAVILSAPPAHEGTVHRVAVTPNDVVVAAPTPPQLLTPVALVPSREPFPMEPVMRSASPSPCNAPASRRTSSTSRPNVAPRRRPSLSTTTGCCPSVSVNNNMSSEASLQDELDDDDPATQHRRRLRIEVPESLVPAYSVMTRVGVPEKYRRAAAVIYYYSLLTNPLRTSPSADPNAQQ